MTDRARRPDLTADAGRKGKSNFCCGTVRRGGSLADDLFGHHSRIIPKAGCSPVPVSECTAFDFVPEILPGARHRAAYRGEEEFRQVGGTRIFIACGDSVVSLSGCGATFRQSVFSAWGAGLPGYRRSSPVFIAFT